MKTLLIMQDFLPGLPGGIANYVYRLCRDLQPQIEALVPVYGDSAAFDAAQRFPIHRRRIPVEPPAFMRESRFHWLRLPFIAYVALAQCALFVWHGARLAHIRKIDVLLMGHLYLAPIGALLGALLDKPYGVMLHGGELHRYYHWPPVRWLMAAALNRAAFLTVNTEFTRRQYVEQRGVRPDQRFVDIYPGVDTAKFRPDADGSRWRERLNLQGRRVLLTVARLVEWKGHATVLAALPAVLEAVPGAHYVIAGTGPFRPELERIVDELGLQQSVTFAGFVADEELPALYCSAELFVQASLPAATGTEIEGFGITFVEASACGLPVIGGRTGGTGEAIAEGETGLRVAPGDAAALAQAIIRLLGDRELAQRFGRAGRERAAREFDWAIQTAKLRAFLEEELPGLRVVTPNVPVP